MFTLHGTFSEVCAFLIGYDLALEGGMLTGFREWIIVRLDADREEFAWPGHVVVAAFSGPVATEKMTSEEDAFARETLFRLLDEFLVVRNKRDGLSEIFLKHVAWVSAQRSRR
jgi:hypothetical protein